MLDFEEDLRTILLIAVVAGLVGGLAFQLLQGRRGGTGLLEMPGKGSGRLWDSGFLGSMFLGAVAAVAFLLVYQPVEIVSNGVTTKNYPTLELIAMSLVVGAAGSSILGALTASALNVATAAKLENILEGLKKLEADANDPAVPSTNSTVASQTSVLISQVEETLAH